jgi:hypothetical protein
LNLDWLNDDDRKKAVAAGFSPNYIGRQMRLACIEDGASEEQAGHLVESWLGSLFAANTVSEIDTADEAGTLPESEVQVEPEVPVEEWELNQGQELREAKGDLPTRITHVGKRDVKYTIDPKKKYSIVDPEAEPLTGETSESAEQIGPRTDVQPGSGEDSGGRD